VEAVAVQVLEVLTMEVHKFLLQQLKVMHGTILVKKVVIQELKKEFLSLAEDLLSNYEMKVFRLYISGLRAKEISARLGKSEKSVNNAIFRMRAKIRRKIKQDT
jgi:RNA polymerase sporulation-specific sigma factor